MSGDYHDNRPGKPVEHRETPGRCTSAVILFSYQAMKINRLDIREKAVSEKANASSLNAYCHRGSRGAGNLRRKFIFELQASFDVHA